VDSYEDIMRIRFATPLLCLSSILLSFGLSGCALTTTASPPSGAGLAIQGSVYGGQQPIVGAHIYLFAANTTGYGAASVSLLQPTSTGLSDSVGGYVLSKAYGAFDFTGDYSCTANTQVYVYALGGNPGAGTNSASGLLASLGNCPSSGSLGTTTPFIYVNEVSTVAAAYAMSGYAVDATHVSSSGTALAVTGITNAFANAANLATLATGVALVTTPSLNGTAPQTTVNAIANILASCVNSTGPASAQCVALFAAAKSSGATGTTATDTATAAINIAHNPGQNVTALYALATPSAAFSPTLSAQPNDFTVGINYNGGTVNGGGLNGAYAIAIDSHGDAWVTSLGNNALTKLSSSGAAQSPGSGFLGGAQSNPNGVAIDFAEEAWVIDGGTYNLTQYSNAGAPLSPAGGYTGGGIDAPQGVAIDGSGNEWIANYSNASISKFNNAGAAQSGTAGYAGGGLNSSVAIAIDSTGQIWVANQKPGTGSISKLTSAGVAISSTAGFQGGGINNPFSVAIDASNNAWIANYSGNSVSELNVSGTAVSGIAGFTGGGLSRPYSIAVDGGGNIWVANFGGPSVTELSNTGAAISPSTGYKGGSLNGPQGIAVDGSGNVWVTNANNSTTAAVTELIGASVPVVTPLANAVRTGNLGGRP
jgi:sugar lactone lactonase YvrE